MAKLEDIMPELKIEQEVSHNNKTATGRKRRAWLADNDMPTILQKSTSTEKEKEKKLPIKDLDPKGVYRPLLDKGSIDQVHRPLLDPVYRPLLDKGSIDQVHRPLSLNLADLRSNPLQLIRFLYAIAEIKNNEYTTRRVRLKEIMQHIDISKDSARTALRFLLKRNIIERIEFKPGQSGWSRYTIAISIFKELENGISKGSITPFEIKSLSSLQKGSNSSSNLLNTTNNIDPFDWGNVDVSPLESIGFTDKHLLQIKTKVNPELVQESINHFAYALNHNPRVTKYEKPLAAFIAVLKRGEPWIEPEYRSAQEIALEKLVAQKKAERRRLQQLEEESYKLAFEEWKEFLSHEELEEIAPTKGVKSDFMPQNVKLNIFFQENIWPQKKKEYLG
jgi:predicted DNA-binding transcriptional regulator